jgi:hypothetical protein
MLEGACLDEMGFHDLLTGGCAARSPLWHSGRMTWVLAVVVTIMTYGIMGDTSADASLTCKLLSGQVSFCMQSLAPFWFACSDKHVQSGN